jgi:hypothetical protein
MNDMKNTKTDWIQMKRDRAVLICDVIMSASIGAIIVLLAIHFTQ